jgi:hypothetical protein
VLCEPESIRNGNQAFTACNFERQEIEDGIERNPQYVTGLSKKPGILLAFETMLFHSIRSTQI